MPLCEKRYILALHVLTICKNLAKVSPPPFNQLKSTSCTLSFAPSPTKADSLSALGWPLSSYLFLLSLQRHNFGCREEISLQNVIACSKQICQAIPIQCKFVRLQWEEKSPSFWIYRVPSYQSNDGRQLWMYAPWSNRGDGIYRPLFSHLFRRKGPACSPQQHGSAWLPDLL